MLYPLMFRLRQLVDAPRVDDIPGTVRAEIRRLRPGERIRPGQTVAVAAGSRGIANLDTIVRTVVEEVQALGARPFIVPAMGSHGGGTAEGQERVLAGYGITGETMGAPVRSSMEVVEIGVTDFGMPVYFDRLAAGADHIVVVNRIKPHTRFAGAIESGLMKMLLIGLGKHEGAALYHRAIVHHSFDSIVRAVSRMVRERLPVAFGVAILENPWDETACVVAVPAADFEETEKALLRQAKIWCPRLPFNEADLLIIDEMGKDISGTGIDTNVTGRKPGPSGQEGPRVLRILVRDLTERTHGNAVGIGYADFATDRLVAAIDQHATYTNALTAQSPEAARLPIHFPTDREALDAALGSIGLTEPRHARVLWIRNTLDMREAGASAAYLEAARQRADLEIVAGPEPLPLAADGRLPPFAAWATGAVTP